MSAVSVPLRLRTAISQLAQHEALLEGSVTIPGVEFDFVEVPNHADAFRRMGHEQEFDVCEWSIVSYLLARQEGMPVTALPVVPRHAFSHRDFLVNRLSGITVPADLNGLRVGTRSYSVTPGVLDRGVLADEFGVSSDDITWVLAEDEHIPTYQTQLPKNVVPPDGRGNLYPLLVSGELPAGIAGANGRRERSPEVVPLFPDAEELDRTQFERTGIVPVFTVVVVHQRVLSDRRWLLEALFEALRRSAQLHQEWAPGVAAVVGDFPFPFGLSANQAALEQVQRYAAQQHILRTLEPIDELFERFD